MLVKKKSVRESKTERDGSKGKAAAAVEDKGFFFIFLMRFSTPELGVWATPRVLVPV